MSGHSSELTNKQIVDKINRIAKDIAIYIQNEEYHNGHILGHNVYQFYSKEAKKTDASGIVFGTVIEAQLQEKPTQIFVLIKTFNKNNHRVLLPIRRERAIDILYKMQETQTYIDFVVEKYQASLETREQEYRHRLQEAVLKYDAQQMYNMEVYGLSVELVEMLELKDKLKTKDYDAKIQRIKFELRIAKEFFEELEQKRSTVNS